MSLSRWERIPAAERYIRNQLKASEDAGISARLEKFDGDIPKEDFLKKLAGVGRDGNVDGIILQTPFPKGWPVDEIVNALPSGKDVEGVHPENLGRLYLGETSIPLPCTAWAAISLLEWYGRCSFEQSRCAVIGRSPNVGRAAALMLMDRHGTVTVCHTRTSAEQLKDVLSGSDVVIAAAGVAGIIDPKVPPAHAWWSMSGPTLRKMENWWGCGPGLMRCGSPQSRTRRSWADNCLLLLAFLLAHQGGDLESILLPDLRKLRGEDLMDIESGAKWFG